MVKPLTECQCSITGCGICDYFNHAGRYHECETCNDYVCDECFYCVHDFGRCAGR